MFFPLHPKGEYRKLRKVKEKKMSHLLLEMEIEKGEWKNKVHMAYALDVLDGYKQHFIHTTCMCLSLSLSSDYHTTALKNYIGTLPS